MTTRSADFERKDFSWHVLRVRCSWRRSRSAWSRRRPAPPRPISGRPSGSLWTTILETPTPDNPFGSGGPQCFVLGGKIVAPFGGGSFTCTVKAGTRIFIAAWTTECSTFAGDCGGPGSNEAQLRAAAEAADAGITATVTINGEPVPLSSVETGLLTIHLPQDNIFGLQGGRTEWALRRPRLCLPHGPADPRDVHHRRPRRVPRRFHPRLYDHDHRPVDTPRAYGARRSLGRRAPLRSPPSPAGGDCGAQLLTCGDYRSRRALVPQCIAWREGTTTARACTQANRSSSPSRPD